MTAWWRLLAVFVLAAQAYSVNAGSRIKASSADLPASLAGQNRYVAVFIPSFSEPPGSELGRNAASLVNLSVWKTLRRSPYPNPRHLDFGVGTVVWTDETLAQSAGEDVSWEDDNGIHHLQSAQLVLDGAATSYGTGAVVTARLVVSDAIDPDEIKRQRWRIVLPGSTRDDPHTFEGEIIPAREYEFRSVPLVGEDLAQLSSPSLLEVHGGSPQGPVIGRIGNFMRAFEQDSGYAEIVTGDGLHGFVRTPRQRPELLAMAEYIGGVIRLLRGDWEGAATLLRRRASDPTLPASLSVDAFLMSAYCTEQLDQDGLRDVERAAEISPFAPRVARYRVMVAMSAISRARRSGDPVRLRQTTEDLRHALSKVVQILGPEDPWVRSARDAASRLQLNSGG